MDYATQFLQLTIVREIETKQAPLLGIPGMIIGQQNIANMNSLLFFWVCPEMRDLHGFTPK